MGAHKNANVVDILVPEKWKREETTLGFPFFLSIELYSKIG